MAGVELFMDIFCNCLLSSHSFRINKNFMQAVMNADNILKSEFIRKLFHLSKNLFMSNVNIFIFKLQIHFKTFPI